LLKTGRQIFYPAWRRSLQALRFAQCGAGQERRKPGVDVWSQIVLGGVVAAVIAAIITGRISRSIKISEFRQAWIDALRKDIADYIGAAHKWVRKYEQLNALVEPDTQEEKNRMEREELLPIHNEALVILSRIKLRFNPRKNPYKKDDDKFLVALDDLLKPDKLPPSDGSTLETSWLKLANEAVDTARTILKREWEITKQPGQWV
jgi:hypothetical protein